MKTANLNTSPDPLAVYMKRILDGISEKKPSDGIMVSDLDLMIDTYLKESNIPNRLTHVTSIYFQAINYGCNPSKERTLKFHEHLLDVIGNAERTRSA